MAEKLTEQIAFRVNQTTYNKLAALSVEANDRSLSDTARKLLEERLDEHRLPPLQHIKNDLGDFLRDRVDTVDVLQKDLGLVRKQAETLNQTCQDLAFDIRKLNRSYFERWIFFTIGVITTIVVMGAFFELMKR